MSAYISRHRNASPPPGWRTSRPPEVAAGWTEKGSRDPYGPGAAAVLGGGHCARRYDPNMLRAGVGRTGLAAAASRAAAPRRLKRMRPGDRRWQGASVKEIMRTNDQVLVSAVEALLKGAGIPHLVLDQNMSVLEGSLGILPRRILVSEGHSRSARLLLEDAGLGQELRPEAG
jgi:hypothetical protein